MTPDRTRVAGAVPVAARRAAVVVAAEGAVLLAVAVGMVVGIVAGAEAVLSLAVVDVVFAAGAGLLLLLLARGLSRGSRWARSPVVLLQVLALPVGWTLMGNGRALLGVAVVVPALLVLGLLLLVSDARQALGRHPRG